VTVGEIAEAAGISRRTLFRLLAAKEEIAVPVLAAAEAARVPRRVRTPARMR
jgi:AcrR family transcriptional regulator